MNLRRAAAHRASLHRHVASVTSRKHSFQGWGLDHKSGLNPHSPLASLEFIFCLLHNLIILPPQYFPPPQAFGLLAGDMGTLVMEGTHKDKSFKSNEAGLFLHSLQLHCGAHSWRMGRRLKSQVGFNKASPTGSQFSRGRTASQDYEAGAGDRLHTRNEHPVYTWTLSPFL